jgi:integrase
MSPNSLGHVTLKDMRPALVQSYLDGWTDKPGKQASALSAFRALNKWARKRDLLSTSIIEGVEVEKSNGGHIPWTDAQVAHAVRYARPDVSRVVMLGAWTGQRVSDLARMCPTDIDVHRGVAGINVTQKKTGRQVWVPIFEELADAMASWGKQPGPFLRRLDGSVWRPKILTDHWDDERQRNPELEEHRRLGLVLHGLRGHCCVRLSRQGLTDHQIGDIVGMSIPMVTRYTRLSSQRENALAAVIQLGQHRTKTKVIG